MKLKCLVSGRRISIALSKSIRPKINEVFEVDNQLGESLKQQPYFEEVSKESEKKKTKSVEGGNK